MTLCGKHYYSTLPLQYQCRDPFAKPISAPPPPPQQGHIHLHAKLDCVVAAANRYMSKKLIDKYALAAAYRKPTINRLETLSPKPEMPRSQTLNPIPRGPIGPTTPILGLLQSCEFSCFSGIVVTPNYNLFPSTPKSRWYMFLSTLSCKLSL